MGKRDQRVCGGEGEKERKRKEGGVEKKEGSINQKIIEIEYDKK